MHRPPPRSRRRPHFLPDLARLLSLFPASRDINFPKSLIYTTTTTATTSIGTTTIATASAAAAVVGCWPDWPSLPRFRLHVSGVRHECQIPELTLSPKCSHVTAILIVVIVVY